MDDSPIPDPPAALAGLDALTVGRSLFGVNMAPPPPVVAGFTDPVFLAQGGLGQVWSARREADGLPVALKIPHRTGPEPAERLVLEAEALRHLDHPHIVRLLDLTEDAAGAPVLVMELVDGPALTALLPAAGFEFEQALQIFLPVLEAVAYAHRQGVIHRDLKPANILIAANGTPKVSDFGLACSLQERRVAFSLTRTGSVAGTVEYLAPECYEPDTEPSAATDVFALRILLYEMLAGRPPRGAWSRLSQKKKLDVRLDELVAEAIHPDPAHRLASAETFRRRLEEIRDTRPRYAGTPLTTGPVRAADALWTVAGLYFLAAGFCSQQRVNNTNTPAVFDLTFGHSQMLGGFWAVWILTCGLGLLGCWQTARLWRFRRVPLCEALPSPFGLRLGASRGAAVAAGLAQVLCFWGPLIYLLLIALQTWQWITPETPPWQRGLAVTKWSSETPVSPWMWNPSAFSRADEYWIREMRPAAVPGTYQLIDRQSFFIFTQPLLMAMGVAGILLGVTVTFAAVMVEGWRGWRPVQLAVAGVVLTALTLVVRGEIRSAYGESNPPHAAREERVAAVLPELDRAVQEIFARPSGRADTGFPETLAVTFDATVERPPHGPLPRGAFLRQLEAEVVPPPGDLRTLEAPRRAVLALGSDGCFRLGQTFEYYMETPGISASGSHENLKWDCRLTGESAAVIFKWEQHSTLLFSVRPRVLTQPEATAWLEEFLRCLSAAECPELERFFLPQILLLEPSDSARETPAPAAVPAGAFRVERSRWRLLEYQVAAPLPVPQSLAGGRQAFTCQLRQTGSRPDGRRETLPGLAWSFELVPANDGEWRALRLRW